MITIKVVPSLNFFGQGNYCTKNLCAMCRGTKADFSQCRSFFTLWKKCFWIYSISAKSVYIIDSKKYVIRTDIWGAQSKRKVNIFVIEKWNIKTVGAKGRQIFFSGKAKQNKVGAKERQVFFNEVGGKE